MEPEIDKIRLLESMRAEFAFFERTLAMLSPDDLLIPDVNGGWSVKDTVAHLTFWMENVLRWFDQAGHSEPVDYPPDGYPADVLDRMNDERSARDHDLPLKEVIAHFRKTHRDVCELVEAIDECDLFDTDWDGAFKQPPWHLIADNTYDHLHEHLVPIRRWIAARSE
ncbi:MAG: ClbS/DfsB family four-helix bundle protein [Anaerolineae bacterium]|nr:ClbS/DfsB family four-helix bundle protein [Anaerolineae bacterium]